MLKEKKRQSLPRHTVLAPMGKRIGATIVDAAIAFLMALILYFAGSRFIFAESIKQKDSYLYTEEYHSNLVQFTDSGERKFYISDVEYETYLDVLEYYYLHYLAGVEPIKFELYDHPLEFYYAPNYNEYVKGTTTLPKDYYTMEWFNINILGITEDIPSEKSTAYFEYVLVDGVPDKSQRGVKRAEHYTSNGDKQVIPDSEVSNVLSRKYNDAYVNSLMQMDFYYPVYQDVAFLVSISWLIPLCVAAIIYYAVIPLSLRNSATFGKKIFKLGLCGIDGYSMQKWPLFIRVVPLLVTLAGVFLIPTQTYYISFIIGAVMFMISFALFAASPKHCSLHDYAARTLVIDTEGSIIFDNQIEEEEFLKAEDEQ